MLNSITPTKGSSSGWLALRYRISPVGWHKGHKAETSFLLNLKQNSFDMLSPFMCKLKWVKNVLNGLGGIVWTLEQKWELSLLSVARRGKSSSVFVMKNSSWRSELDINATRWYNMICHQEIHSPKWNRNPISLVYFSFEYKSKAGLLLFSFLFCLLKIATWK